MTDTGKTARVVRPNAKRSEACRDAISVTVLIWMILSVMPVHASVLEQKPIEAVKGTVTELLDILKEFKGPNRSEARRREIEQVIKDHVHYIDMAKRSLGISWVEMSDAARREYVGLFVQLLRDALANRMIEYSGERIRYLSERRESGFAEVRTRLVGNKVDTFIDFRLMNQDGRWLVYDAVMDGASLVGSYHAQFASIIREASCAQLMERLKEKTLIVKLFEKSGS